MMQLPQETLIEVKEHLEKELKRVENQIQGLSAQDPFANTDRLTDNAASDTEAKEDDGHERVAAITTELKKKRDEIIAALDRIKNRTYGICTSCKKLIDTDRLAMVPTAVLCMDCQKKRV